MVGDALDYLFGLEHHGIKLGLENITRICVALGDPQRAFESVIIAGTNGKGSVAAMVETAVRRAGVSTGCFTSPHLVTFEERFIINGRPVSTDDLTAQAEVVRATIQALITSGGLVASPTFFEATTAIAFNLFREVDVQIAVLEVGMGGRFDATNIVSPVAAAVTTVDLDHQQFLGQTLGEIAFEKAGVIKPGVVVVTGETKPAALDVLRRVCDMRDARLVEAVAEVSTSVSVLDGLTELSLRTPSGAYGPVTLALRGQHQVANAVVAVRLLEELRPRIPDTAIVAGLTDAVWPGRLELVEVATDRWAIMDAAHNVAAADALGQYLAVQYREGLPLVLAVMRDKDVGGMLDVLRPCVTHVACAQLAGRRAVPARELASIVADRWPDIPVDVAGSPAAALQTAWQHGPVVCVAGSIYLVGEVRHHLSTISEAGAVSTEVPG